MPSHHIEALETITALKRKLRRDKDVSAGTPTEFATNRGNKLRTGARYIHAGSLPYKYGPNGYKERIEHAGYQRHILQRNPKRHDEYGDELEEEDSDAGADLAAESENPYADIKLEELLRPLTHPSELMHHSALSQIYNDPALPNMVKNTEAQLREERKNLWNAKNLYRHFTGDESWIPCEKVEAVHDWDLFGPHPGSTQTQSRKRKLNEDDVPMLNGVDEVDYVKSAPQMESEQQGVTDIDVDGTDVKPLATLEETSKAQAQDDTNLQDSSTPQTNGIHKQKNGVEHTNPDTAVGPTTDGDQDEQVDTDQVSHLDVDVDAEAESRSSTPAPLPRRITRALAAGNNPSAAPTPPLSPALSSPTISDSPSALQPHPLFLLPQQLTVAHQQHASSLPLAIAHSGLPPDEILETRKFLGIYIQKAEETIRALSSILAKLIKAKRRRDKVVEWCIAESHVGELSDGEDWIDEEFWQARGELRKGKDEDETMVNGETAEEAVVGIGGRKGKRRRGVKD